MKNPFKNISPEVKGALLVFLYVKYCVAFKYIDLH